MGDSDDLERFRQLRIIEELDPARLPGLAGLKELTTLERRENSLGPCIVAREGGSISWPWTASGAVDMELSGTATETLSDGNAPRIERSTPAWSATSRHG